MTDNFNRYREFINLCGGLPDNNEKGTLDKYYVIELMRRGKDNSDMPAANYHFRNYYIYSWHDLEKYEEEIKSICTLLKMRAYCSVNYKLMSQVALDTLAESARRIAAHDYKKFYNIFESCSGKYAPSDNNLWVIDFAEDYGWVAHQRNFEWFYAPHVNHREIDRFTFSTNHKLCIVHPNTYTLAPSIFQSLAVGMVNI